MPIRKILCLLLCLMMLVGILTGCGSQNPIDGSVEGSTTAPPKEAVDKTVILCEPIDAALWQTENKSDYMDFNSYFFDLEWISENYDALADYIELLCTEYDFEQSGETYCEFIWDTTFFDIVLRYTGKKTVAGNSMTGVHSNNQGDLILFGTLDKYGKLNCHFQCDPALQGRDDGYRYGKAEQVNQPSASMELGLRFNGHDAVYETTDGRLSAKLNQACILTDGQSADYPARYEIDLKTKRLAVYVENEYGDVIQHFHVPTLNGWRTAVYPTSEFIIESNFAVMARGIHDTLPTYTWENLFASIHNGQYVYPVTALSGEMNGMEFRVMYQDENVIVFYTRATFRSAPNIVEALVAVSTDVEPVSEKAPTSSGGSTGSSRCSSCSGSGNCGNCSGSGRVIEWTGGEYMNLPCTRCGGTGNCWTCDGDGRK